MVRSDALACVEELKAVDALGADDDRALWVLALSLLLRDAEYDILQGRKRGVWIELGACSHWLRPHQTRWTADGGFAYPAGYNNSIYSFEGLPQFDWSVVLRRDRVDEWRITTEVIGRRPPSNLELRLTFPTRTARHQQAVIHSHWNPGTPANPREKRTRFYGFRRSHEWELRATTDFPKSDE